jgi:hypothetical protein
VGRPLVVSFAIHFPRRKATYVRRYHVLSRPRQARARFAIGKLLEAFAYEKSEAAFAELVERCGPMV